MTQPPLPPTVKELLDGFIRDSQADLETILKKSKANTEPIRVLASRLLEVSTELAVVKLGAPTNTKVAEHALKATFENLRSASTSLLAKEVVELMQRRLIAAKDFVLGLIDAVV